LNAVHACPPRVILSFRKRPRGGSPPRLPAHLFHHVMPTLNPLPLELRSMGTRESPGAGCSAVPCSGGHLEVPLFLPEVLSCSFFEWENCSPKLGFPTLFFVPRSPALSVLPLYFCRILSTFRISIRGSVPPPAWPSSPDCPHIVRSGFAGTTLSA